jgi:hypothetical protein
MEYNVYCDESCHLPNDSSNVMVLGAIWLPKEHVRNISENIRHIKVEHGLSPKFEVKWVKVSSSKLDFYRKLLNFFFDQPLLRFRSVVITGKSHLNHEKFHQTHDDWYYKMYFQLLEHLIGLKNKYNIYLDIKDSRGGEKVKKLHEILCNIALDFDKTIVKKIQLVRSHESELIQLVDLLIGLLSYHSRGFKTSKAKLELIDLFKRKSGYSLTNSTPLNEAKTNLFFWSPQ